MPRKPTQIAKEAREQILLAVRRMPEHRVLPTTRELGEKHDLHPSTIFRILRELAREGHIWQSPNGRFYPIGAQKNTLRGAPLCFIGRELFQWSRLYKEILEGVSEVCGANGSPLVLLSSSLLVRQDTPSARIRPANLENQSAEMARLTSAMPSGCAGFILDHLWRDEVILQSKFRARAALKLLSGSQSVPSIEPDYSAGARLVAEYLSVKKASGIFLIRPFKGDSAVDQMINELSLVLAPLGAKILSLDETIRLFSGKKGSGRLFLVAPEDNTALTLKEIIHRSGSKAANAAEVIATQGTGLVTDRMRHLCFDYRQLGRSAAAFILHGTRPQAVLPSWRQHDN